MHIFAFSLGLLAFKGGLRQSRTFSNVSTKLCTLRSLKITAATFDNPGTIFESEWHRSTSLSETPYVLRVVYYKTHPSAPAFCTMTSEDSQWCLRACNMDQFPYLRECGRYAGHIPLCCDPKTSKQTRTFICNNDEYSMRRHRSWHLGSRVRRTLNGIGIV